MPTNFTVVPVDDGRNSAQEDSNNDNVLREEDEDAAGEPISHGLWNFKKNSSCRQAIHMVE